jgi:hypothetical protein
MGNGAKNSLKGWQMRAIIRFSVEQENNGALRNKLNKILIDADFIQAQNTATYERKGHRSWGLVKSCTTFGARRTPMQAQAVSITFGCI